MEYCFAEPELVLSEVEGSRGVKVYGKGQSYRTFIF